MVFEIDGTRFSTLEEFYGEFSRVVIPGFDSQLTNLDAFDDVLSGGCGTPDDGFTLRWKNHEVSKQRLGYPETVRQLELRLTRCHPTNRPQVAQDLKQAQVHRGPTVFDWLTDMIHEHGSGGRYATDGVELLLD
jgi:RNAse (barnase) inhibitor barstar